MRACVRACADADYILQKLQAITAAVEIKHGGGGATATYSYLHTTMLTDAIEQRVELLESVATMLPQEKRFGGATVKLNATLKEASGDVGWKLVNKAIDVLCYLPSKATGVAAVAAPAAEMDAD